MTRPLAAALGAFAALLVTTTAVADARGLSAPARRGLSFARQHCAACHAVAADGASPNPESPPFEDIANRTGVTAATLGTFLRDSHNFPEAMAFRVDRRRISDLSAYIITLRKPGYRPTR